MSDPAVVSTITIVLFVAIATVFALFLVFLGRIINPTRPNPVKNMPYESGMDPIHSARRRFDVRFHLVAIAFLVFDVELLFLYPWAVMVGKERLASRVAQTEIGLQVAQPYVAETMEFLEKEHEEHWGQPRRADVGRRASSRIRSLVPPFAFEAGILFTALLVIGYIYDWRKGVFSWR